MCAQDQILFSNSADTGRDFYISIYKFAQCERWMHLTQGFTAKRGAIETTPLPASAAWPRS